MSEYIVDLPMSGAADEFIAKHGVDDCWLYGYKLTGEIVRCGDCKWAKPDHSDHEYRGEHYRCNMWIADVDAYGFCFRAIRKEGSE